MVIYSGKPGISWDSMVITIGFCGDIPSGQRLRNELERSTVFNGKKCDFYAHFQ